MRQQAVLVSLAAFLPVALAWVHPRQNNNNNDDDDNDDDDNVPYQDIVCRPQLSSDEPLPPCISIEVIERACLPNGTDDIHYDAHAQCMCGGSFFPEKLACDRCHFVHGMIPESWFDYYSEILDTVSEALCTGTPTAPFASLYTSVQARTPVPGTPSQVSDQFVSETDVSHYYTASGEQGAGEITGDATEATATTTTESGPQSSPEGTGTTDDGRSTTSTTSNSPSNTDGASGDDEDSTTTTGDSGAMPTPGAGAMAAWGVAAGVAVLAAV